MSSATGKKLGDKLVVSQFCLIPKVLVTQLAGPWADLVSQNAWCSISAPDNPFPKGISHAELQSSAPWTIAAMGFSSHGVVLLVPHGIIFPGESRSPWDPSPGPIWIAAERVQPWLAGSVQLRCGVGWRWKHPLYPKKWGVSYTHPSVYDSSVPESDPFQ